MQYGSIGPEVEVAILCRVMAVGAGADPPDLPPHSRPDTLHFKPHLRNLNVSLPEGPQPPSASPAAGCPCAGLHGHAFNVVVLRYRYDLHNDVVFGGWMPHTECHDKLHHHHQAPVH